MYTKASLLRFLKMEDKIFNPRNPDTYKFATNNQLVIDGIPIYHEYDNEKRDDIRKQVSEKEFVNEITSPSYIKIQIKIQKWDEAINITNIEFRQKGIDDPKDRTQGYIERINEIYQELLNKPWEINPKYIEKELNSRIFRSSPMPPVIKSMGGYGFTQAQLEVLGSLPDEDLAAIGKTMSSGLRGGKLEQALFNAHGSLNRDWHYLAELYGKNVEWEKKIMSEYFSCYEFDTKDQVYKVLNSSEYLNIHPELRKEAIKKALESLEGLK
jgi:hypothetical protein